MTSFSEVIKVFCKDHLLGNEGILPELGQWARKDNGHTVFRDSETDNIVIDCYFFPSLEMCSKWPFQNYVICTILIKHNQIVLS